MWFYFIENYNGKLVILLDVFILLDKVLFFMDVLGLIGFVGVLGIEWFVLGWDVVLDLEYY